MSKHKRRFFPGFGKGRRGKPAPEFCMGFCCPYCDHILETRVDDLRPDGLTSVTCFCCERMYYVRRPLERLVYPQEFVVMDDDAEKCDIVTLDANRIRGYHEERRKALKETKE